MITFKRLDIRPLMARGEEPLTRIRAALARLPAEQGLALVTPFLPAPLIEMLAGEGYQSRVEPAGGGDWVVYFRRSDT